MWHSVGQRRYAPRKAQDADDLIGFQHSMDVAVEAELQALVVAFTRSLRQVIGYHEVLVSLSLERCYCSAAEG